MAGSSELAALARDAEPFTDALPVLEYRMAAVQDAAIRDVQGLELIRAHLSPLEGWAAKLPADVIAEARTLRERNLEGIRASALLRQSTAQRGSGDWQGASRSLFQAVEVNDQSAVANRMLADFLAATGNRDAALGYYDRALAIRPRYPRALRNRDIARGVPASSSRSAR